MRSEFQRVAEEYIVDINKHDVCRRTPGPGLKLRDWWALSAFEMGAGASSSSETDRAALRAALGDLYLRHATELNPLGLDFSSFGMMKTSPNARFRLFNSAHRASLDARAFAVRLLDASCYIRWSVCLVQKASAFGVRVEAWSTLCFQVDPGSGATRHKIKSVAQAGGVHRDARRRGWHLARVLAGL